MVAVDVRSWIDLAEKEAGRKLLAYLTAQADEDGTCTVEALTPEERALVVKRDPGIKVKAGFYQRVCSYVRSADQLKAVFQVIVPIAYPAHHKYAINDTPEERAGRLVKAAADIIGVGLVEGNGDGDGNDDEAGENKQYGRVQNVVGGHRS